MKSLFSRPEPILLGPSNSSTQPALHQICLRIAERRRANEETKKAVKIWSEGLSQVGRISKGRPTV